MQNSLLRLIAAGILAAFAAIGNFLLLTKRDPPIEYVRFADAIALGETIKADALESVAIPGVEAELTKSLIRWDERQNIEGRKAARAFEKNSLALAQDFTGKGPQWRELGPFRLLSVGDRIRNDYSGSFSDGTSGNSITIEARVETSPDGYKVYSPEVRELLGVLYDPKKSDDEVGRIVNVSLHPDQSEADLLDPTSENFDSNGIERFKLADDARTLTVPLAEVDWNPEITVRGSWIVFVVKL